MIRGILLILLIFFSEMIYSQKNAISTIKFETEEFDFGDIKINERTSYTFYFTNTGNTTIKLKNVTASCGCTTPQWDSLPIAPGKKGSILVVFQCFPLEKTFNKFITVESNAEPSTNHLEIKGKCIDIYKSQKLKYTIPSGRLLFDVTHVNYDKIYNNVTLKQKEIRYFNNSEDTITVYEFSTPPYLICASAPNVILPYREGVIFMNYNASLNPTFGFKMDKFKMITNDKDFPEKTLFVSAEILEYFDTSMQNNATIFLKETGFEFGKIKVGEIKTHNFEIKNTGTDTLIIRQVRTSCGCTVANLSKDKIAPGKTAQLKVTYNTAGATKGINNKPITIISTDRKNQVVNIGVSVVVE